MAWLNTREEPGKMDTVARLDDNQHERHKEHKDYDERPQVKRQRGQNALEEFTKGSTDVLQRFDNKIRDRNSDCLK